MQTSTSSAAEEQTLKKYLPWKRITMHRVRKESRHVQMFWISEMLGGTLWKEALGHYHSPQNPRNSYLAASSLCNHIIHSLLMTISSLLTFSRFITEGNPSSVFVHSFQVSLSRTHIVMNAACSVLQTWRHLFLWVTLYLPRVWKRIYWVLLWFEESEFCVKHFHCSPCVIFVISSHSQIFYQLNIFLFYSA